MPSMSAVPDWLVRNRLRAGTLAPVLANVPQLVSDVHLVWPETPYLPTRVRVAIDALAAEVPSLTAAWTATQTKAGTHLAARADVRMELARPERRPLNIRAPSVQ